MNTLQIISIAVSMVCVIITTVLAWIMLNKRTQTEVSFTGVPVDKSDFDTTVKEIKRGMVSISDEIKNVKSSAAADLNREVVAVHNRVNEVLSAVSNIKGVVEQLSLRIGELRGDLKANLAERRNSL